MGAKVSYKTEAQTRQGKPDAFLEETIRIWQPISPIPLTLNDAREIAYNLIGLFVLLARIDQRTRQGSEKRPADAPIKTGRGNLEEETL